MTLAGILEDLGTVAEAISTVAIGGSGYYFAKGIASSSSKGRRLASGVEAFNANRDRVCRWAAWSGVMTAVELVMEHVVRHEEGPLNLMVACGATSALFSVHRGTCAAVREGLVGAALGGVAGVAIYGAVRVLGKPGSSAD